MNPFFNKRLARSEDMESWLMLVASTLSGDVGSGSARSAPLALSGLGSSILPPASGSSKTIRAQLSLPRLTTELDRDDKAGNITLLKASPAGLSISTERNTGLSEGVAGANAVAVTVDSAAGVCARDKQLRNELGHVVKEVFVGVGIETSAAAIHGAVPAIWVGNANTVLGRLFGELELLALEHGLVDGPAAAVVELGRAILGFLGLGPAVGLGRGEAGKGNKCRKSG
ncbi:hypothetical protein HG531_009337 [Fusarium graminearum]|nr:hypothetical protein HG531_009337 [Fusarium graminearum]